MIEPTFPVTPFTAQSTAAEVASGVDLTGRRAVVTGGASGIGIETARALAGAGAEVTLAVRDLQAGERVAVEIGGRVRVAPLDLADQRSVAAFTAAWDGPLHILVNNAGVMMTPELRTPQGWELQFATNHLGHFALATGLHRALAAAGRARVVALSSVAHLREPVDFDDLHFRVRAYDPEAAYAQSKTANALFAVEANRRWAVDGITVNAVHPGAILTNLTRHMDQEDLDASIAGGGYTFKTPEQGAATSVLVAASPLLEGVGGRYFEDCAPARRHVPGTSGGVADHALDPGAADRLWRVSLDALGA
ncbi:MULTISPECIES: SDR family NAD(P)-dependent oxidoreductase [unclassified Streptosporangium]|uniref:SDR family NAD(P)-dependent oxidoreductase n=1 Tax=unclassified Streptosporangium TaxID=2632669 RepID=UPI002E2E16FD|nr:MULTISPECIES: SDR family NAD(P)-dependent oxidoreductase [unclassified Streptosporangium]